MVVAQVELVLETWAALVAELVVKQVLLRMIASQLAVVVPVHKLAASQVPVVVQVVHC